MDTKLKKFSYSPCAKWGAFLLAFILIFAGSYNVIQFILSVSYDSDKGDALEDVIMQSDGFDLLTSEQFCSAYFSALSDVSSLAVTYKDGSDEARQAYVTEQQKYYEEQIDDAVNDIKANLEDSFNDYFDYYLSEGYISLSDEEDCDGSGIFYYYDDYYDDEDYDDEEESYYNIYYYVVDREAVADSYSGLDASSYSESALITDFNNRYEEIQRNLKDVKNLKIAFVDTQTGTVYSNISGYENESQVSSDFAQYDWYLSYSYVSGCKYSNQIRTLTEQRKNNYYTDYESNLPAVADYLQFYVEKGYQGYVCFDAELTEQDIFSDMETNYDEVKNLLYRFAAATVAELAVAVVLSVFLLVKAGRTEKHGDVKLCFIDKQFNILHFVISCILTGILVWFIARLIDYPNSYYYDRTSSYKNLLMGGLCAGIYAIVMEYLLSLTRNIKAKTLWKNNSVYFLISRITKRIREVREKPPVSFDTGKYILISAVSYSIFVLLSVALMPVTADAWFFFVIIFALVNIALFVFGLISVKYIGIIMNACENAQNGIFENHIDAGRFPFWLKKFANDVLNMQNGMHFAVDEAIKNEKMKTELITNVSHDLKTPLTAIINYSDLLSKCDIPDKTMRDYVNVISDRSDRLKKLIEDLTEASKASSGAISVNLVKVNLNEIANQIMGEVMDDMKAKNINILLHIPEVPVHVRADSRLLYRVLENLMSNVKKYAMPNTRAYVTVGKEGSLTISNISEYPLGVSAKELTGRFVRGDKARTDEGSGLGLSIADDLCRLQNGKLEITVDSDLFKAKITLEPFCG